MTPDPIDFVGSSVHAQEQMIGGIAAGLKTTGVGTVIWKVKDINGVSVDLKLACLLVQRIFTIGLPATARRPVLTNNLLTKFLLSLQEISNFSIVLSMCSVRVYRTATRHKNSQKLGAIWVSMWGQSMEHAGNVLLVFNPLTKLASPQYHVIFDESF